MLMVLALDVLLADAASECVYEQFALKTPDGGTPEIPAGSNLKPLRLTQLLRLTKVLVVIRFKQKRFEKVPFDQGSHA